MGLKAYPVIDLAATGDNIRRLRMARGLISSFEKFSCFETEIPALAKASM